jgi:hypothetical protein
MIMQAFRWWYIPIALIAAMAAYVGYDRQANIKIFKYRLTMDVEVDGRVQSASSIIEVYYSIGGDVGGAKWNTVLRGVAPMMDLGKYGTLLAGLAYEGAEHGRKLRAAGLKGDPFDGSDPQNADALPLYAYKLATPKAINAMKGKVVLQNYPMFIWIPPSDNWRDAKQLVASEIGTAISRTVDFVQMTPEPAPSERVVTKIEPAPAWLVDRRESEKRNSRGHDAYFTLFTTYVERNN